MFASFINYFFCYLFRTKIKFHGKVYVYAFLPMNTTPGGGGAVLPKGLKGTCGQPGYVSRNFCLKQGIDFIIFCLKQGIFSWTINSLRVCSTN